ncbi:MAG: cell division protein FtsQ/DivIB [Gammaproteobacteria bacterium]|nr:cell division protein FtsQ/DivIB [Gammaproteobacteria bacterium]
MTQDEPKPVHFRPTRRTLAWSFGAIACVALAIGAWRTVVDPHHFVIEKIRLEGTFTHVDIDTLKPRIASHLRGNFFTVDTEALRNGVSEIPWIKHVETQRLWPHTLHVTVYEREAIARWLAGGALDRDGTLFVPDPATLAANLPVIDGPQGLHTPLVKKMLELQGYMQGLDAQIARLDVDARRAYRLTLRDGVQLMLGRKDMEIRLARYARAFSRLTDEQRQHIVRVDLRYNNGFALARDNDYTPPHKG